MNSLNQYTQRTVPGYVNVLGEATNTATVTVNLQPTSRKGSYYRAELLVTNTSPLWLGLTNIAVLNQGTNSDLISTNKGNVYVAAAVETPTYDFDGNLTSESLWTNSWSGENRRTNVESRVSLSTAGKMKEVWTYLPDGRWIERVVWTNNGTYFPSYTNRYVWDGQVLRDSCVAWTNGLDGRS